MDRLPYLKYEQQLRDKQAEEYEKNLLIYKTPVELLLLNKFFNDNLKELLKKENIKLLDAGCGTGRFIKLFVEIFRNKLKYYGIDLSENSLKIAKERLIILNIPHHLSKGTITDLSYESNFFDIITCLEVFEHILKKEDQIKVLNEIRRCLKPDGLFIMTTFNYSIFDKLKQDKIYLKFNGKKPNYIRMTKKEIKNILRKVFLEEEIISIKCGLCFFGLPFGLKKFLYNKFPRLVERCELLLFNFNIAFALGHMHFICIRKREG